MYAIPAAADILGVTPEALETALERGETIATLTRACGLDVEQMTEQVLDAEVPDVEALATIAGFDSDEVSQFSHELRSYLISFIHEGEQAANARFDRPVLAAA
jgi:hypothetical protein